MARMSVAQGAKERTRLREALGDAEDNLQVAAGALYLGGLTDSGAIAEEASDRALKALEGRG